MMALERLLSAHATRRWMIRLTYAITRWPRTVRLLKVRYLRRWAIVLFHRHRDRAPSPSMITLRMTNSCNLRCVQCSQWGEHGVFTHTQGVKRRGDLSTDEWFSFIRRMSPLCPHIYFFGGEPFMRKDL